LKKSPLALAVFAAATLILASGTAGAQTEAERRFKLLQLDEMTPAQRTLSDSILNGPRKAVADPNLPVPTSVGSPFNVWLRSPELGDRLQKIGEHIRFKSTLGSRLNEFAILITARQWTAQYEWFAHHRLAMQAGLSPSVATDVAEGRVPSGMKEDEAIVYRFTRELHLRNAVSDATYAMAKDRFGEQGVVDLISVNGYYVLVAMTLNVDRTPIPGAGPWPLKPLAKNLPDIDY
jgi:4-carboxymuconolactone decarboxylase